VLDPPVRTGASTDSTSGSPGRRAARGSVAEVARTRVPELTTRTVPLAPGERAPIDAQPSEPRVALIVLHETDPKLVFLAPGSPVVVGRKAPADVTVADSSLSRAHARFVLDGDATVRVEDLGSTNGTWRGGARIRAADLAIGEGVHLGGVPVQIERLAGSRSLGQPERLDGVITGTAMRELMERLPWIAASTASVLLHGETGTGKEVLARRIHESSGRGGAMVRVNCGAIPAQLVEATLFGHERGAFTGAAQQRKGVFEDAAGGTVFLDEIGELPLPAQAALLRVLDAKAVTRVGATREIPVDVRVVSATHRDLEAMAGEGTFREDLFYRLATVVLRIPPLRARRDEIEPLALRFLADAAAANGRRVRAIAPDALARLESHGWPGNIRELKNAMEHAAVLARGERVELHDLPERVRENGPGKSLPDDGNTPGKDLPDAAPAVRGRVGAFEARLIREALEAEGWSRSKAAKRLGLPVRTLSYRMKVLGIARDAE